MTLEMHPQRWGDPAEAQPLPDTVRGLVDAFVGTRDTPASTDVTLPASGLTRRPARLAAAQPSATTRCTSTTTPVACAPAASPRRTCSAPARATSPTPPTRSSDPGSHEDVAAVLAWAVEHHVAVVPFGGGTCVTGGLVARRDGFAGLVSLDLVRLDRLLSVDEISRTAVLQPGMRGPAAEAALAEHGLTLGHFPQSFEFASIGGFAATRSSGQSSAGFGRFDDMVVGLRVATPTGELVLGSSPANAAGPDLREAVLGSEGTLGVITEVTVRVRPVAAEKAYEAWSFPTFAAGADAMRQLSQARLLPTVLRLSDEAETMVNLASQKDVGGEGVSGLRDDRGPRGRVRGGPSRRGGVRAGVARRHRPRRGARPVVGGGTLPRALPPRLDARRRRPRRDPRDRHLLVQPRPSLHGREVRAGVVPGRGNPRALPHLPRLRDRVLALLHRGHGAGRRPDGAVARPPRRRRATP